MCAERFSITGTTEKTCVATDKTNCIQYNDNENNCKICEEDFFENSGSCTAQDLADCDMFTMNKNECMNCAVGFSLVLANKTCLVLPTNLNCENN